MLDADVLEVVETRHKEALEHGLGRTQFSLVRLLSKRVHLAMNVTIENFDKALLRLRALVPQSEFVAIDLEFTGLDQDSCGETEAPLPPPGSHEALAGNAASADDPRLPPAGSKKTGGAADNAACPASPSPALDLKREAQAKYAKMCETTKFLVVQVSVLLHVVRVVALGCCPYPLILRECMPPEFAAACLRCGGQVGW